MSHEPAFLSDFFNFHLYPVITEKFCKNGSSINTLKKVLASNIRIVQLREKEYSKKKDNGNGLSIQERNKKDRGEINNK